MQPAKTIKVVGQDPSLRNWGLATGTYCLETGRLQVSRLDLINPVLPVGKQVRQNSRDLESALQLYTRALAVAEGAHAVFVEVPIGSQSARAMASYGICVGVLGALRAEGTPFYEVTPTEVKLAAVGNKNATKAEMIDWATNLHPEANWPIYKQNGSIHVSAAQAEHMADAIGAIYAGLAGNAFQQLLSLWQRNTERKTCEFN